MKSAPQKAVHEQMACAVLAAYPKAMDTSHVVYFHTNLAKTGLTTFSRNQFSQLKNRALHFVVFTELTVTSRAVNSYVHKLQFL